MTRPRTITLDTLSEPNHFDPNLSTQEKFERGLSCYENGDHFDALNYFLAAKSPSENRQIQSMAHHAVGLCYFHGIGSVISLEAALNHLRLSVIVGENFGVNTDSARRDLRAIEQERFGDVSTLDDLFLIRPISAEQLAPNQINQFQQL